MSLSVAFLMALAPEPTQGQESAVKELHDDQVGIRPTGRGNDSRDDPLDRLVSISADNIPLKQILQDICRQSGLVLELDVASLEAAGVELDEPRTSKIDNETLRQTISRLANGYRHRGVYAEVRDGRLFLSTFAAKLAAEQEETRRRLPDWLKPLYTNGIVARVDDSGSVVSIYAGSVTTDELLSQLKTLPQLRELNISVTKAVTPAGLQHLAELKTLKKLNLFSVNEKGKGLGDDAILAVQGLDSLRELSVSECGTTDAGVKLLEAMPQLTHLRLEDGRLTDEALNSIATLKRLKQLDLTCYLGSEQHGRMRFTAAGTRKLAGLEDLEILSLIGHEVPPDVLVFPQLTSLSLSGPAVDDVSASRIAKCRNLKSLVLSYTAMTDKGLKQIAAVRSLQRIEIRSRVITDAGIEQLKQLPALRNVSLGGSQLTDESLRHLAEVSTLSRLDLRGSRSGPNGARGFTATGLQQLKQLQNLQTLYLTFLNLDDNELAAIRGTLPNTSVQEMPARAFWPLKKARRGKRRD